MTTEFIMHSGQRTIGGVNVSIIHGNDRVIFEMGAPYDPATNVFDGRVEQRGRAWVRDGIRLGTLPRIDGIYRREDIDGMDLIAAEDSVLNTSVFITHNHLDHMAGMGAVAPDIPVYLTRPGQVIEAALAATGNGVPNVGRTYTHFEYDVPIRVGEIEVLPIVAQTESYGMCSLLVTTPDGTVHWTSDLTLHGHEKHNKLREIEILRDLQIDVLLCDATAFTYPDAVAAYTDETGTVVPTLDAPAGAPTEEELDAQLFSLLAERTGLCVINYYQREMLDVRRLRQWCEKLNRTLVLEPDAAYIAYKHFGWVPTVFIPDSDRFPTTRAEQDPWLRELLDVATVVTRDDIHAHPSRFLLQNSYRHILELLNLPTENSVYLHSEGEPISPRDASWANMERIVDVAGFEYLWFGLNSLFGHGFPGAVKYYVDQVDPAVLIPCHSREPQLLLPKSGVQLIPEPNRRYVLANRSLTPLNLQDSTSLPG